MQSLPGVYIHHTSRLVSFPPATIQGFESCATDTYFPSFAMIHDIQTFISKASFIQHRFDPAPEPGQKLVPYNPSISRAVVIICKDRPEVFTRKLARGG